MKTFILSALTLFSISASANIERKLFTVEKSHNPENIMVIHTHTDSSCRFVATNSQYLDFYWLMGSGNRKEVHSMIRNGVNERIQFLGINSRRDSFKISMNDLKEVNHDLTDRTLEVISETINGRCQVKSILTLGPSAKYRRLNLKRTYCEVTSNLIGIPNGCKTLELEGLDADTGEPLKVKFRKN